MPKINKSFLPHKKNTQLTRRFGNIIRIRCLFGSLFLGNTPSFNMPNLQNDLNLSRITVCTILGFVAGILGVLFARLICNSNTRFSNLSKLPNWLKPALAGFIIGIIGLFCLWL